MNSIDEHIGAGWLCLQWWQNDKISCLRLFQESQSIHGFNLIQLIQRGSNQTRRHLADIMHKIFTLYREGKIKPVIDSVFTFEEVREEFGSKLLFTVTLRCIVGEQCHGQVNGSKEYR